MPFKADIQAADRLLKAAVTAARDTIKAGDDWEVRTIGGDVACTYRTYDRAAVVQMLTEATRSAELLLSERVA